jgi:hypothetical protein
LVSSEVDNSTFSEENSRFFLLPKGIQRQKTRSLLADGSEVQILNVYLTTEAVALIQKAEEAILEKLEPDTHSDRDVNLQFNEHKRLVNELSRVRELLNI